MLYDVHKSTLTTVPPNKPVIYTGAGRSLAKILQSFNEGSELSLLCEVIGGSPPPKVTWHFNGAMDDTYTLEHGDITINRLDISNVTRKFLRARLICRASNTHLVPPLTSEIILDINCEWETVSTCQISLTECLLLVKEKGTTT